MGFLPTDFFQKREKSWAMISFQGWEALFIKYAIYKKTSSSSYCKVHLKSLLYWDVNCIKGIWAPQE